MVCIFVVREQSEMNDTLQDVWAMSWFLS